MNGAAFGTGLSNTIGNGRPKMSNSDFSLKHRYSHRMISHSLILLVKLQDLFILFKNQKTCVLINLVDREDDVQLDDDGEEATDEREFLEQHNAELLDESKQ